MKPSDTVVLSVRNLVLDVVTGGGSMRAVDDVSFDVHAGELFGIVGESGSGKSISVLAIMGLLPGNKIRVRSGQALFGDVDLLKLSEKELNKVRGGGISMVFQDPMSSLNPVLSVGAQIEEIIRIHNRGMAKSQIRERGISLLETVGVPDPARRFTQYPHEFSGGMRQRAMIALAIANNPRLIIADEPTTALDVTIQAQVMELLEQLRQKLGTAIVLISHDLGLVAENADRVGVLYGGRLMEQADVFRLFDKPSHPYTVGLLNSLPRHDVKQDVLYQIPGQPPSVGAHPSGCVFHPRCGLGSERDRCRTVPPTNALVEEGHLSRCHFADEVPEWAIKARP